MRLDVFARGVLVLALLSASELAADPGPGTQLNAEQSFAWRGVGRVNVGGLRSRSLCTGTLIAPDVVLTAAHCVVNQRTGIAQRLGSIFFVAGWRKGEMTGHSTAAALSVHPFYKPDDPGGQRGLTSDLALIRLRDPMTPEAALPFSVAPPPAQGSPILVVSYRRDRPHALTYQQDCTFEHQQGPLMVLGCPVASGASGAPVLAEINGERRVIGTLVAMSNTGLAYAVQAEGAVENLLASLDNTGPAAPSH